MAGYSIPFQRNASRSGEQGSRQLVWGFEEALHIPTCGSTNMELRVPTFFVSGSERISLNMMGMSFEAFGEIERPRRDTIDVLYDCTVLCIIYRDVIDIPYIDRYRFLFLLCTYPRSISAC